MRCEDWVNKNKKKVIAVNDAQSLTTTVASVFKSFNKKDRALLLEL
jgi:hypothetical protein